MSEFRSVMITGGAVADYMGEKKKKGGRRTKKSQEGGTILGVANFTNMASMPSPSAPSMSLPTQGSHVSQALNVSQGSQASQASQASQTSHGSQGSQASQGSHTSQASNQIVAIPKVGGEVKSVKVELKKKPQTHKVKLQPKKDEQKKKKVKKTRKFTIGISSLHKRMTRAKKVHKSVKGMPLDKLKELLISKKLIKPTSKAPESVLRQIAADSQIVDKNAL